MLQLLADGMTDREIAEKRICSYYTVRGHCERILWKLGAKTRAQAVAIGMRQGLIE